MSGVKMVKLLDADLPMLVLHGPVSRDSDFSLYMRGPITASKLRHAIRQMELTASWLADDETSRDTPESSDG